MNRKNLSSEQRRAATVDAVIALAATTNPAEITTANIAAHMGVTQGALFRHFSTKQEIWAEAMDWTADSLMARFNAVKMADPIADLRAMFAAHVEFVVTYPGVPRILFGELQRRGETPAKSRLQKFLAEYGARVTSRLTEAKKAGLIGEGADVEAAAVMFLGIIQGLVMQAMMAEDLSGMTRMSARLFSIYLDGIGCEG